MLAALAGEGARTTARAFSHRQWQTGSHQTALCRCRGPWEGAAAAGGWARGWAAAGGWGRGWPAAAMASPRGRLRGTAWRRPPASRCRAPAPGVEWVGVWVGGFVVVVCVVGGGASIIKQVGHATAQRSAKPGHAEHALTPHSRVWHAGMTRGCCGRPACGARLASKRAVGAAPARRSPKRTPLMVCTMAAPARRLY